MAVVVDASAVAAVTFNESSAAEVLDRLAGHALVAPTLIDYELANIGWKKLRYHPDRGAAILANLARTRRLRIDRITPVMGGVVMLAHALDITPYDASYLWVSRSMGLHLVTLDQRLARAAEQV